MLVIFPFLSEKTTEKKEEENLEAVITKPSPIFIGEGEEAEFTLSGENSKGNIVKYSWDYTDSWKKEPFQEKASSKEIHKTYSKSGKYWFALKVVDKEGREAQNETYVAINYGEEYKGSLNNDESENHSFPVSDWGVLQIYVKLTYPYGGTPSNNLSVSLYDDNGDRVDKENKYKERKKEGGNNIEEIILPLQEVHKYKAGKWNAEVKRNDDNILGGEVEYNLKIEVIFENKAVH